MTISLAEVSNWLNAHPKVKAVLITAEGAAVGVLMNAYETGALSFSKDGLKKLGLAMFAAMYLAIKNYKTQAPRQPWTAEQKAAAVAAKEPPADFPKNP
jgi:hypothetical protein